MCILHYASAKHFNSYRHLLSVLVKLTNNRFLKIIMNLNITCQIINRLISHTDIQSINRLNNKIIIRLIN